MKVVAIVLAVLLAGVLVSCKADLTYEKVGTIQSFEIIARSWNTSDKIILTMTDGSEFILTYGGQNFHTGQILLRNAEGYYKIEEEQK
jgi:hypothetical protein